MSKTNTVQKNDTLSIIANRFGVTVTEIQKANATLIKDINKIKTGWVLVIPTKTSGDFEKQLKTAIEDVKKLSSVKKLFEMLGG